MSYLNRILILIVILLGAGGASAAELVQLGESNWEEFAPAGKEVDAIYGDYVLRNDKITVVIANPVAGRHANLTVKEVGGCIIDMTRRDGPAGPRGNDQLSAYYPNAMRTPYRALSARADRAVLLRVGEEVARGDMVMVEVLSDAAKEREEIEALNKPRTAKDRIKLPAKPKPAVHTRYTLKDGWDYVLITTTYRNNSDEETTVDLIDTMRADRTFESGVDAAANMVWVYDRWFGQAYGIVTQDGTTAAGPAPRGRAPSAIHHEIGGERKRKIAAGETYTMARRLYCGENIYDVTALALRAIQKPVTEVALTITDALGPVEAADVIAMRGGKAYARGRTDAKGKLTAKLPPGDYQLEIFALGRTKQVLPVTAGDEPIATAITMDAPGIVVADVTDGEGRHIPCKVQFIGIEPTVDPFFFVDTGDHGVHNCVYSHSGKFEQIIGPGRYKVIVSYGPEHDAVFTEIAVTRGERTQLTAKLPRSVDSKGWISADFHSHSSPSGDNTTSQLGRVLNLLAEHIEFAPCTEHQRVDSYIPHLKKLDAERLLATCTGMELTGLPLPLNHHNIFPLTHKPHTQDGGGPLIDYNPRVQIERAYLWENKSEKVVQQNHPDIIKMFFDKDGDNKADGGLDMASFMNVIEVHPPAGILEGPTYERDQKSYPNRIFNWLILLNKGYRIPGVVNTDSHYNFHGSGWLRNYVKSPTDDPAKVQTLDIVRETNKGHIVMTTGPFMEVRAGDLDDPRRAIRYALPGDDLRATKGRVMLIIKVQCPNWFDINRVQVLINGRPDEKLNFTRKSNPDKFGDKVVKFEQRLDIELKEDAHIIVAALGEGLTLGEVMGPRAGKSMPVAVSNPIYVDVDGDGFKANGDELGAELPTKADARQTVPIIVRVNEKGEFSIGGKQMTMKEVNAALTALASKAPDESSADHQARLKSTPVVIKARAENTFGTVKDIMEGAKAAGLPVSIIATTQ